jgi:hypothetical protein
VELPLLRARDLDDGHADAAEHLEVGARVAANARDAPQQKDRGLDASLHERARDDEPSPPLLPRPQTTPTRLVARSSNAASIAATAWRPAFSMSTIDGMPMSSIVRRSASRICSVLSTRMRRVERSVLDCVNQLSTSFRLQLSLR